MFKHVFGLFMIYHHSASSNEFIQKNSRKAPNRLICLGQQTNFMISAFTERFSEKTYEEFFFMLC